MESFGRSLEIDVDRDIDTDSDTDKDTNTSVSFSISISPWKGEPAAMHPAPPEARTRQRSVGLCAAEICRFF